MEKITATGFLIFLCMVNSISGNCLIGGGCPAGNCCSSFGFCGATTSHCGSAWQGGTGVGVGVGVGDCRQVGCPAGTCCSQYGYCGTTAEHCGWSGTGGVQVAPGNCAATGCPAGSCCSRFGYCGNTAEHCAGTYNSCGFSGCGAGTCCSSYGYCGNTPAHCQGKRSMDRLSPSPASIDGSFKGEATYYNATAVSSHYTLCGTKRLLNDNNEMIGAINALQFDPYTLNGIASTNKICSRKALITGPSGTKIIVKIVDRCPDCQKGDLALSRTAFLAVAGEMGTGHVKIDWQFI